jgi:hypothetical protein
MPEDDFVMCSSYALLSLQEGGNFCTYRDGVRIHVTVAYRIWFPAHGVAGNGFVYTAKHELEYPTFTNRR